MITIYESNEKIMQALFELCYENSFIIRSPAVFTEEKFFNQQVTHWAQHDKDKHLFMSKSACDVNICLRDMRHQEQKYFLRRLSSIADIHTLFQLEILWEIY